MSMPSVLVAIAGPLNGSTFALNEAEVCIGREAGNQIQVQSASVSRRHCALRRDSDGVVAHDLESRNGTFINGIPITRQKLKHGDLLTVGDCCFRYVGESQATARAESAAVQLQDTETLMLAPEWLAAAEAIPSPAPSATGADTRALRDLNTVRHVGAQERVQVGETIRAIHVREEDVG